MVLDGLLGLPRFRFSVPGFFAASGFSESSTELAPAESLQELLPSLTVLFSTDVASATKVSSLIFFILWIRGALSIRISPSGPADTTGSFGAIWKFPCEKYFECWEKLKQAYLCMLISTKMHSLSIIYVYKKTCKEMETSNAFSTLAN